VSGLLPAGFEDLEDLLEWAIPTEEERYQKRLGSTMDELQAFYDRMQERVKEAKEYLEELDYDDLPEEAQRLLWLLMSLICVSFAVEVFGVPQVPDSGSSYVRRVAEPPTFPV
jgi:hypothetical protein